MNKEKSGLILKLFGHMFMLSAMTFGGGYVIISFMKKKFVDKLHWLSEEEMSDYTAIAQVCPGSLAINMATVIGRRICGAVGAAAAVSGALLPPVIIITALYYVYSAFISNIYVGWLLAGMQSGIAAVLADVASEMIIRTACIKEKRVLNIAVMCLTFISVSVFGMNVVYSLLVCVLLGIAIAAVESRGRKAK